MIRAVGRLIEQEPPIAMPTAALAAAPLALAA
jgi:hypothetical protein